jgi:prophage maintenance system killer protein
MKKGVTVSEVEQIVFDIARQRLTFNEPIPDFSTRRPHILESCLAAPLQTFGGRPLYPRFARRAAMLFYLMIKNHPFENGNKRIAMVTLFYFLYANGKWLNADDQELFLFTMWVAESLPAFKDDVLNAIEKFLASHMGKISS